MLFSLQKINLCWCCCLCFSLPQRVSSAFCSVLLEDSCAPSMISGKCPPICEANCMWHTTVSSAEKKNDASVGMDTCSSPSTITVLVAQSRTIAAKKFLDDNRRHFAFINSWNLICHILLE
ncbi:hypothetical protein Q1695_004661 [Nippostrongylus brasiliensis]|nr:hypothetical protein Q1695_004661 [Nippostrongylus brasiliensis]